MKKTLEFIGNALKWIQSFISRLGTLSTVLLVITVIFATFFSKCQQAKTVLDINAKAQKILRLEFLNESLEKANKTLDSSIIKAQDSINVLKKKNEKLDKIVVIQKKAIETIEDERDSLLSEIHNSTDSTYSYKYLLAKYPFPGQKNYTFNYPQVVKFHEVDILAGSYKQEVDKLNELKITYEAEINGLKAIEQQRGEQIKSYVARSMNSDKIVDNTNEQKAIILDDNKKQRRWIRFWQAVSIVGFTLYLTK